MSLRLVRRTDEKRAQPCFSTSVRPMIPTRTGRSKAPSFPPQDQKKKTLIPDRKPSDRDMDGSSNVTRFDDGLYHPGTKSSPKHSPPSTVTDPDATTIVSAASADAAPVDPSAATPTSLPTSSGRKSKHTDAAAIPHQSFAADSSATSSPSAPVPSSSSMPTPEDVPVSSGSMGVEAPPALHNSPRVAVIAFVSILGTLLVVGLLVAFLTSQRFRRWREGRRARYRETNWKISRPVREAHSPDGSMCAVRPQVEISTKELLYGPVDPFARSIPRLTGRMPFNLVASHHADPVEEIDEERGWLWGTTTNHASSHNNSRGPRFVTPGIGFGKYRSKRGRQASLASQPSHLDAHEFKEELLYSDDEAKSVSEYDDDDDDKQQQAIPSMPLTGASYLLGRLKESIKSRSAFGSLGSSTTRNLPRDESCSRGRWNEVGQLVDSDEKAVDYGDEKMVANWDSYLSEVVLPELPAITWDDHSGLKLGTTKRMRAPSLDVEIDGAPVEDLPARQSAPRREPSAVGSSVRQLVSRLEEREGHSSSSSSSAAAAHLPSSQSSSRLPPRRKRKEALVLARLPSLVSRPNSFSSIPSSSSTSSSRIIRTAGPKLAHGLVKNKSKHLYPGGYRGRSPTKKLRRKEPPAP
ncbi:uncharacterized protein VP01_408g5 [Puccinia sorghi]|uniref:Uncharacterized protein n=1 Tax=Puccinia sorghi TaxID=27349 RepID=A0A0L6URF0_9BASI|nr:uncharacterized protein VP01_408g5 [Puccinia sorghi]